MIRTHQTKVNPNRAKRQRVLTDPKFLIGVLLILSSIAFTTLLVAKAKGGAQYYELLRDIPAGQTLTNSDVRQVTARVDSDAYLPAGELLADAVTSRSLYQGELLPKQALLKEADEQRRQLVVKVSPRIPSTVKTGSSVELWVIPDKQRNSENENSLLLAEDVTVVAIPEAETRILSDHKQSVEISIPASELPKVLEYTQDQYQLVLVPKG